MIRSLNSHRNGYVSSCRENGEALKKKGRVTNSVVGRTCSDGTVSSCRENGEAFVAKRSSPSKSRAGKKHACSVSSA
ncbi:hypothetical protein A2U01_0048317, partial [Trifolium medium]|nr:hypothetical protein [Trifolium medium]